MSDPTPRTPPRVRVVVLNWNAWWFTRRCLRALRATEYPSERFEVVLVDNASVDGSLERLRHEFPRVRVVANPDNLGFAEGCNRAMRDLDGVDLVALVNNDAVVDPGWLSACVAALEAHPRAGAAAARLVLEPAFVTLEADVEGGHVEVLEVLVDGLVATSRTRFSGAARSEGRTEWPLELVHHLDPGRSLLAVPTGAGEHLVEVVLRGTGSLQLRSGSDSATGSDSASDSATLHGGHTALSVRVGADAVRTELLNGLGTARNEVAESYDRHFGEADDPAEVPELDGPPLEVPGFSGGGVVLRTTMLREVGLFDPRFFAYYEDSDLSWRAARAGWTTVTAPGAVIRHSFGGSGGARAPGFFFLNYRNWLLTVLRNADGAQRRAALASARERVRWALRANVASPLKHRRRPDGTLLAAWCRTLAGVADVRRRRPGGASDTGAAPIGWEPTDDVRSAFQPRFGARPPAARPGGPLLVALDLTEELALPGAGVELLRTMAGSDEALDVVTVCRDGGGGWSWVEPAQLSRLLGLEVPGRRVAVGERRIGALPPGTALVRSAPGSVGLVVAWEGGAGSASEVPPESSAIAAALRRGRS